MSSPSKIHFGEAFRPAFSADIVLQPFLAVFQQLSPTTTDLNADLPDARLLPLGGPILHIVNDSAIAFTLRDSEENVLRTVNSTNSVEIYLIDNSTQAGEWLIRGGTAESGESETGITTLGGRMICTADFSGGLDVDSPAGEVLLGGTMTVLSTFLGGLQVEAIPVANIVSPTASGSGTGTLASPWNLRQARRAATPGMVISCLDGPDYPDNDAHCWDTDDTSCKAGTLANPITVRNYPGDSPVFTRKFQAEGSRGRHLRFEGITIEVDGSTILNVRDGATNVTFRGCTFNDVTPLGVSAGYSAIYVRTCDRVRFTGCTFLEWRGNETNAGDWFRFENTTKCMIDECDMSQCFVGHAILGWIESDELVVRRNVMKNPWDRILSSRFDDPAWQVGKKGCLFEGNVFFESNDDIAPTNEPGAEQAIRFNGYANRIRNNIVAFNLLGKVGGTNAAMMFSAWSNSRLISDMRGYHNTFYANETGAIGVVNVITSGSFDLDDNYEYNSVLHSTLGAGHFIYRIGTGFTPIPWETYRLHNSILWDSNGATDLFSFEDESPEERTLDEVQNGTGSNPLSATYDGVFEGNIRANPVFVNPVKPSNPASRASWFNNFRLQSSSPGLGIGRSLAKTTSSGQSTTRVAVDDPYPFWGNWGHPDEALGDLVVVGQSKVRVVDIDYGTSELIVSDPISFPSGAHVYLSVMKSASPTPGIWGTENAFDDTPGSGGAPSGGLGPQTIYLECEAVSDVSEWDAFGTADKVEAVTTDDDTKYIGTDLNAKLQKYTLKDPSSALQAADQIDDVQIEIRRRRQAVTEITGNVQVRLYLDTEVDAEPIGLPPEFETIVTTQMGHPVDGDAWTLQNLKDLVVAVRSLSDAQNHVSRLRVKVTYTPNTANTTPGGTVLFNHNFGETTPFNNFDQEGTGDFTLEAFQSRDVCKCEVSPVASTDYRAQVSREGQASDDVGSERVYAFNLHVPSGLSAAPNADVVIAEWDDNPDGGDVARDGVLRIGIAAGKLFVRQSFSALAADTTKPGSATLFETAAPYGQWLEIRVEVRWRFDSLGYLRVWFGDSLVVNQLDLPNCYNDTVGPWIKLGVYLPKVEAGDDSGDLDPTVIYVEKLLITDPAD